MKRRVQASREGRPGSKAFSWFIGLKIQEQNWNNNNKNMKKEMQMQ
jgi:hypothetical protein